MPLPHITIKPRSGWQKIDLEELFRSQDLFFFIIWRDLKVRYAQSVLGIGWALIQPVFSMIIFTIIFGNLAKFPSDGIPYALFSYIALVPWTYFSNALVDSSNSLSINSEMLTKIYFPRMILPLAATLSKLIDFIIAMSLVVVFMFWYKILPTWNMLLFPYFVLLLIITAGGMGMWLTALSIQYRDIRYGLSFFVQLIMYASPIVYPLSIIPEQYRLLYALNPLVGIIEGFRCALLGKTVIPWNIITLGTICAIALFISGAFYFRRMERVFADVA